MADAGFERTIQAPGGSRCDLPHATYYSTRYVTVEAANAAATAVAAMVPTSGGHGVISGGADVWFAGLKETRLSRF
jgi:hypothetical protein